MALPGPVTKNRLMKSYRIGNVTKLLGISADTLRYYEKIRLLPPVSRTGSGIRMYDERDISRLRFIRRAQKMRFSLKEIAELLTMREDPQHARDEVRILTKNKLSEVEEHLDDLRFLRNELKLLLNLCTARADGCPIIERIDQDES
jgi:MerR family transcriptional regulator, copper efflux regulator